MPSWDTVKTALGLARHAWKDIEAAEPDPWEHALAQGVLAHAAHAAGEGAEHRAALSSADAAFTRITDNESRDIVLKTLQKVPGWTTPT